MKLRIWPFGESKTITEFIVEKESDDDFINSSTVVPLTLPLLIVLVIIPFVILKQALRFIEDERFREHEADTDFEGYYETYIRNSPLPYRKLVLSPRNKHLTLGFSARHTLSTSRAKLPVLEYMIGTILFLWELLITMCSCCWKAKKYVVDEEDEITHDVIHQQVANRVHPDETEPPVQIKIDTCGSGRSEFVSNNGKSAHVEQTKLDTLEPEPLTPLANSNTTSQRGTKKRSNTGQFYFDSVDDENDVPMYNLMDENGYIFQRELEDDLTPVLIFINTISGPQQGNVLLSQLRLLVNPIQVHDMADGSPIIPLKSYLRRFENNFRILVCGGDGTIAWIVNALDVAKKELGNSSNPPIGILPLGTGNDLARILGWGSGWSGSSDSILDILCHVATARKTSLDRWKLQIMKHKEKNHDSKTFMNYVGVGVDAGAALQVHILRKNRPKLFGVSRFLNKFFYGLLGTPEVFYNSYNLIDMIELYCDDKRVQIPDDCQGIIFLNIDSYAGGTPLWSRTLHPRNVVANELNYGSSVSTWPRLNGKTSSMRDLLGGIRFCESSYNDGLIDVCYVRGAFHLGQIKVGLANPNLLAQAKSVRIKVKKPLPIQTDGEPQMLKERCDLCIERCDQRYMLESTLVDNARQLKTVFSNPSIANSSDNSHHRKSYHKSEVTEEDYISALATARQRGIISDTACEWILQEAKNRDRLRRRQIDEMRRFSFT